jgi:hypothetical protein
MCTTSLRIRGEARSLFDVDPARADPALAELRAFFAAHTRREGRLHAAVQALILTRPSPPNDGCRGVVFYVSRSPRTCREGGGAVAREGSRRSTADAIVRSFSVQSPAVDGARCARGARRAGAVRQAGEGIRHRARARSSAPGPEGTRSRSCASVPLWRSSEAGKSVGNAGVANGVGATGFRACFIPIDRPSVRARIRVGTAYGHPSVGWLDGVGIPVEPFGLGACIGGVDQNDFAPARSDRESPHRPKCVEFGTRQSRWRRLGGRPCAERLGKTGDAERARPCVRTNVTGTSGASHKARFLRRHLASVSAPRRWRGR